MIVKFNGKKLKSIRKQRKQRKLSQEKLAEKADLGDRYIRALESGEKRNPSAVLLFRVSIVLEVPMEELMESEKEAL